MRFSQCAKEEDLAATQPSHVQHLIDTQPSVVVIRSGKTSAWNIDMASMFSGRARLNLVRLAPRGRRRTRQTLAAAHMTPFIRGYDPFIRGSRIKGVMHATRCEGGHFIRGSRPLVRGSQLENDLTAAAVHARHLLLPVNVLSVPKLEEELGKWEVRWKREFKFSWREAGPPNHHDDKVDSDQ